MNGGGGRPRQHTLALYLDADSYNVFGGELGVRYCGFDGNSTDPAGVPCGCVPNLVAAPGFQVGGGPWWSWGTSNNCLYAANATQSASTRGVYLTFNLSETQAMYGGNARAAGYTAAADFVIRFTLQAVGDAGSVEEVASVGPMTLEPGETRLVTAFAQLPRADFRLYRYVVQLASFQLGFRPTVNTHASVCVLSAIRAEGSSPHLLQSPFATCVQRKLSDPVAAPELVPSEY